MTPSLDAERGRVVRRLESLPLHDLEAVAPLVISACEQIIDLQLPTRAREMVFHPPTEALPSALAAVVFDASRTGAADDALVQVLSTLRHSLA